MRYSLDKLFTKHEFERFNRPFDADTPIMVQVEDHEYGSLTLHSVAKISYDEDEKGKGRIVIEIN